MSWLISLLLVSSIFTTENTSNFQIQNNYNTPSGKKIIVLEETERFEQTYPLNADGKVSISNINGSITIEAWDRKEVKLEVTKIADSKESLAGVEVQIDSKPDYFNAETDYNNWNGEKNWGRSRRLEVQFRLSVPRTAMLDEIVTVNGSVKVSNFTNYTSISAVNGSVVAANLRGTAKLSTVNGTTSADFEQLLPSTKINLNTVNGTVNLSIPSDVNATLKADTVNGRITNDFGLPVRKGKYVGRDLYGKIGTGETEIKMSSVNGELSILRKNNGRNINPVINLLPPTAVDQSDETEDTVETVKSTRKNSSTNARVARRSQIANDRAARQLANEIKKIQPEIEAAVVESIYNTAGAVSAEIDKELRDKLRIEFERQKLARSRNVNFSPISPTIDTKSDSLTIKGKPKVKITAQDCEVIVRGWDATEVKYDFTQISKNKEKQNVGIEFEKKDADVFIKVNSDDAGNYTMQNRTLRLEVFVPKKSDLKIVTNGEIRLEGVTGELDLNSSENGVNVRDSDGSAAINAAAGKIRVIGFKGDVQAATGEGDIYLEGVFDKITANSGEGNIFLSLNDDGNAILESENEIEFENFPSKKEKANIWRIGSGSGKYILVSPEGTVTVRKTAGSVYTK